MSYKEPNESYGVKGKGVWERILWVVSSGGYSLSDQRNAEKYQK